MKKSKLLIATVLMAGSAGVQAEGLFAEAGLGTLSGGLGIGYELNENISVVGGYSWTNVSAKDSDGDSGEVTASTLSAGVEFSMPIADRLTAQVRTGFYRWEFDAVGNASSTKIKGTDPFYGLGVAYALDNKTSLGLNWNALHLEKDGNEVDVAPVTSISLRRKF